MDTSTWGTEKLEAEISFQNNEVLRCLAGEMLNKEFPGYREGMTFRDAMNVCVNRAIETLDAATGGH